MSQLKECFAVANVSYSALKFIAIVPVVSTHLLVYQEIMHVITVRSLNHGTIMFTGMYTEPLYC